MDLAARAHEQDARAVRRAADRLVGLELRLVGESGPRLGELLERGLVDADAAAEREVPAEPRRAGRDRHRRRRERGALAAPALQARAQREDLERERGRVAERVHEADAA